MAGPKKQVVGVGKNDARIDRINQITRHFHSADTANQKMLQALKIVEEYKKVAHKLDRVMDVTSEIAKKWLQK